MKYLAGVKWKGFYCKVQQETPKMLILAWFRKLLAILRLSYHGLAENLLFLPTTSEITYSTIQTMWLWVWWQYIPQCTENCEMLFLREIHQILVKQVRKPKPLELWQISVKTSIKCLDKKVGFLMTEVAFWSVSISTFGMFY